MGVEKTSIKEEEAVRLVGSEQSADDTSKLHARRHVGVDWHLHGAFFRLHQRNDTLDWEDIFTCGWRVHQSRF